MNVFTEVYEKSIELLKAKSLADDWKDVEAALKALLEADGPAIGKAEALEQLRGLLAKKAKGKKNASAAKAEAIVDASRSAVNGYQDRAAMLKMLQHFYMVAKKGGQSIWVVDSPKSFPKWTYDHFSGKTAADLKTELAKSDEVFGPGHRRMMSASLQLARKWAADVEAKLGDPSKATLGKVRRWFHEEGADDAAVKTTSGKLLEGFKKIHATCNSTQVIFSDRPHLRTSGEWDNAYASVNDRDAMPVIYIFQVFLKTGKRNKLGQIPKLWLCALTVIHELSHKLVKTKDKRYDFDGLKPGPNLSPADALENADSWAYFSGDVVGALSKGTLKSVLK
jgi:hypothetical protein